MKNYLFFFLLVSVFFSFSQVQEGVAQTTGLSNSSTVYNSGAVMPALRNNTGTVDSVHTTNNNIYTPGNTGAAIVSDKMKNLVTTPDCNTVMNMMQILYPSYKECTENGGGGNMPGPGVRCVRTKNCMPWPEPAGGGEICIFQCDDGTTIVGR